MLCVHSHSSHKLRTWIPVLIIVQCGLICLFIVVIQDKSKTPSSLDSKLFSSPPTYESHKAPFQGGNAVSVQRHLRRHVSTTPPTTYNVRGDGASVKFDDYLGRVSVHSSNTSSILLRNHVNELPNAITRAAQNKGSDFGKNNELRIQLTRREEHKNLDAAFVNYKRQLSSGEQTGKSILAGKWPMALDEKVGSLMSKSSLANAKDVQSNKTAVAFTSSIDRQDTPDGRGNGRIPGDPSLRLPHSGRSEKTKTNLTGSVGRVFNLKEGEFGQGKSSPPKIVYDVVKTLTLMRQSNDSEVEPRKDGHKSDEAERVLGNDAQTSETTQTAPFRTETHRMRPSGFRDNIRTTREAASAKLVNTTLHGINNTQQGGHGKARQNSVYESNIFQTYDPLSPRKFDLKEDNVTYFTSHGRSLRCLNEGTDNVFLQGQQEACICKAAWHGEHCSVPDSAMYTSALRYINALQLTNVSRRIINAVNFNMEWELLEARFGELGDLVDVFLLVESNYTWYGDPKPLRLLEKLQDGYLREFHHKIAYLFVHTFPVGGRENGWLVDQFARKHIGNEGLGQIRGLRSDDVFLYTDADEIPSRDVLLFLKLHEGYPEPFGLALRWSVFGFFWKQFDQTRIVAGCTIKMLRSVFHGEVYKLRTGAGLVQQDQTEELTQFTSSGGIVYEWYFGDGGIHAGWHCSWCMSPDRIRIKLESAINADFPRWGDYPEKKDLTYIRNLIKTGTWFDDKMTFNSLVELDSDPNLAPSYMIANFDKYKHLLNLKYAG